MPEESRMPALFVGHGSPVNAIEDNPYSQTWRSLGRSLPRPRAILCISAHWETPQAEVTAMPQPRTIHDFGGFPNALYEAKYPAPGSPWLAEAVQQTLAPLPVGLNQDWGLDHGCWSVLMQMYPQADIPVAQLSLDYTQPPQYHYDLGRKLAPLREQGVLILGSGNIVHNLRRVVVPGNNYERFNEPFGLDWALEAQALFKKLIDADDHAALMRYSELGAAVQLAVPTPEHYLPLLYILGLKQGSETLTYFNDVAMAGSITMTGFVVQ